MPAWGWVGHVSSAWDCPTGTSPTARPSSCTKRSGFTGERIAERIEAAVAEHSHVA